MSFHHRIRSPRSFVRQEPSSYGSRSFASPYTGPGSIIFNATVQEQNAPGVTNELAPDAKATATGGPVGGVPGFDGS